LIDENKHCDLVRKHNLNKNESDVLRSQIKKTPNELIIVYCKTILALSGANPMVAIDPLLNLIKSFSIPSLKIIP